MEKKINEINIDKTGRIIIPVDDFNEMEKVVEKAFFLAKQIRRNIVALYVIDTPRLTEVIPPDETATAWESLLSTEGEKILNEIEKKGKKMRIRVEKKIVEGFPDKEIIKEAKKHDLIVMGCRSRGIFDKLLTSNVCEKVLNHSSSSVLTYQIK